MTAILTIDGLVTFGPAGTVTEGSRVVFGDDRIYVVDKITLSGGEITFWARSPFVSRFGPMALTTTIVAYIPAPEAA